MQLALARAARARSKLRLWALSLAGLLAVCVSFTLSLQHHHQLHRPTHHRFRTNEGFRHRDHHAATTAAALEPHQRAQAAGRTGGHGHAHEDRAPVVAEFESLRELRLVPAPEAVRTLLEMERAARVAHDAAAAAKRKAKAVAGSHHHKPAHPKQDRVEGKASGEKEPDATYYTKYLHETLERKAPYPILKGMMHKVIEQFPLAETWLDGGAGTCGVMDALMLLGRKVVGVELSDVKETTCAPLWRRGLVKQGPLHAIPFPSRAFDLVFSTEVLEHVPPALAQQSVDELVRCAKRHVLATISLRASALDVPGKPPKVHLTVRPRAWWEERFRIAGCVRDEDTFRALQTYDIDGVTELSPRIFPFLCHLPPSPATSRPEVS